MFGPPGHAYVYLVYGMYHCLNIVTESEGRPAAVLVRAVEAIEGLDSIRAARADGLHRRDHGGKTRPPGEASGPGALPAAGLASGPGLVCVAFSIDRSHNGLDLCNAASPLRLEPAAPQDPPLVVATGPRIGIAYAGEPWRSAPWRLWAAGNPAVSGRSGRS